MSSKTQVISDVQNQPTTLKDITHNNARNDVQNRSGSKGATINEENKINKIIASKRFLNLLKSSGNYPDPLKIGFHLPDYKYNLRPGLSFLVNDQNPKDDTAIPKTKHMRPYKKRPFSCPPHNNIEAENSEDSDKHQASTPPAIGNGERMEKDKEGEAVRSKRTWKRKISRKQFRHHDIKIFTPKEYKTSTFLKRKEPPKKPVIVQQPQEAVPVSKESITEDIVNTLAGQKQALVQKPVDRSKLDADKEENNNNNNNNNSQNINNNITGMHHLPAIVLPTIVPRRKSMEIKAKTTADMPVLQTESDPAPSKSPEPQNDTILQSQPEKPQQPPEEPRQPPEEPQQIENEPIEEELANDIPEDDYSPEPENLTLERRYSSSVSPVDLSKKSQPAVDIGQRVNFEPIVENLINRYIQQIPEHLTVTVSSRPVNVVEPDTAEPNPNDIPVLPSSPSLSQSTMDHLLRQFACLNNYLKEPFTFNIDDLIKVSHSYIELDRLIIELPAEYTPALTQFITQKQAFLDDQLARINANIESHTLILLLVQKEIASYKTLIASTLDSIIQQKINPNSTFPFNIFGPTSFVPVQLVALLRNILPLMSEQMPNNNPQPRPPSREPPVPFTSEEIPNNNPQPRPPSREPPLPFTSEEIPNNNPQPIRPPSRGPPLPFTSEEIPQPIRPPSRGPPPPYPTQPDRITKPGRPRSKSHKNNVDKQKQQLRRSFSSPHANANEMNYKSDLVENGRRSKENTRNNNVPHTQTSSDSIQVSLIFDNATQFGHYNENAREQLGNQRTELGQRLPFLPDNLVQAGNQTLAQRNADNAIIYQSRPLPQVSNQTLPPRGALPRDVANAIHERHLSLSNNVSQMSNQTPQGPLPRNAENAIHQRHLTLGNMPQMSNQTLPPRNAENAIHQRHLLSQVSNQTLPPHNVENAIHERHLLLSNNVSQMSNQTLQAQGPLPRNAEDAIHQRHLLLSNNYQMSNQPPHGPLPRNVGEAIHQRHLLLNNNYQMSNQTLPPQGPLPTNAENAIHQRHLSLSNMSQMSNQTLPPQAPLLPRNGLMPDNALHQRHLLLSNQTLPPQGPMPYNGLMSESAIHHQRPSVPRTLRDQRPFQTPGSKRVAKHPQMGNKPLPDRRSFQMSQHESNQMGIQVLPDGRVFQIPANGSNEYTLPNTIIVPQMSSEALPGQGRRSNESTLPNTIVSQMSTQALPAHEYTTVVSQMSSQALPGASNIMPTESVEHHRLPIMPQLYNPQHGPNMPESARHQKLPTNMPQLYNPHGPNMPESAMQRHYPQTFNFPQNTLFENAKYHNIPPMMSNQANPSPASMPRLDNPHQTPLVLQNNFSQPETYAIHRHPGQTTPSAQENPTHLVRALKTKAPSTKARKTPDNATTEPRRTPPQQEVYRSRRKDSNPKRVKTIPVFISTDTSMQITMEPVDEAPSNDNEETQASDMTEASQLRTTVIKKSNDNPDQSNADDVEATPIIKQEVEEESIEFLGWLEKMNTNNKLKEKFLKVMGIPNNANKSNLPLTDFIEISDSDDDNEHREVKTPIIKIESDTTEEKKSPSQSPTQGKTPTPDKQSKKLSLSDHPVRISIPYSPEIEPISPVNDTTSPLFTYPEASNATKEAVSAIKHKTLLTFGDFHTSYYSHKLTLNDKGSLSDPTNIEELIPNGKLRYMPEQHAFLRYHDYAQAEMFLKSLESDEEFLTQADVDAIRKAYKNILDTGSKSKQTEMITLPEHVEFTEMECLEDVKKYILERQLVDIFVPSDFSRFYEYVTGFQIVNNNPPISLRTFLTMYNTNRLMELLRKYLIEKGCGSNNGLVVNDVIPASKPIPT